MLHESEFQLLASNMLEKLSEMIEEADSAGRVEADIDAAGLHVTLPGGKQYVISKHTASRQIWVSSPISGGLHFSYDATSKHWLLPDKRELCALLKQEWAPFLP